MAMVFGSKGFYEAPENPTKGTVPYSPSTPKYLGQSTPAAPATQAPVQSPLSAPQQQPKAATTVQPQQTYSPNKTVNQPTTAGGYVVPNVQTQAAPNYLQQPTSGQGGNAQKNQELLNSLGFQGQVGGGAGNTWLAQNQDKLVDYTLKRQQWDPNYRPDIDLDPNTEGVQTFNRNINQGIGNYLGYNGIIGRGEMGSGQVGVDFLSLGNNSAAQNQYEQIRNLFDPNYKYQPINVAPEGWDESAYLSMNPQVQAQVDAGQYITPLQHYLLQGKQQGLQFNDPYSDFLSQLQDMYSQMGNSDVPSSLDAGANLQPISRPGETALPSALSYLSDVSDLQRRSAIATDAVYGAGADKESQDYYLNTLLRGVMNDQGGIENFDINPVERQYLTMLGLIPSSGSDFLTSLQRAYGYGTL